MRARVHRTTAFFNTFNEMVCMKKKRLETHDQNDAAGTHRGDINNPTSVVWVFKSPR
jgi:hypothetical protein